MHSNAWYSSQRNILCKFQITYFLSSKPSHKQSQQNTFKFPSINRKYCQTNLTRVNRLYFCWLEKFHKINNTKKIKEITNLLMLAHFYILLMRNKFHYCEMFEIVFDLWMNKIVKQTMYFKFAKPKKKKNNNL